MKHKFRSSFWFSSALKQSRSRDSPPLDRRFSHGAGKAAAEGDEDGKVGGACGR